MKIFNSKYGILRKIAVCAIGFLLVLFYNEIQSQNPTWQATGTAANGTGAITVAWPAHQVNDVALLFVESCGGEAVTLSTPAGFTAVTNSPQATGAGTAGTQLSVFWCRATSSSMASPVIADPGDHAYGVIVTFRGVIASGDPLDVTAGGVKGSASTSATLPAVTTTVDNDLVVLAITKDLDATAAFASAWSNANLSSITERFDAGTNSSNGGGIAVTDGVKATAGNTGTTAVTVTSSVNAFMTIALKPLEKTVYNSQTGLLYTTIQAAINAFGGSILSAQWVEVQSSNTYVENVSVSGITGTSATDTLTIRAQAGLTPKIMYSYVSGSAGLVTVLVPYVKIDGLEIVNTGNGIYADGIDVNASNVTIINCSIHNCEDYGIYTWSGNTSINISNCNIYTTDIGLALGGTTTVSKCIIHGCTGPYGDGIETGSAATNCIIQNCLFYSNNRMAIYPGSSGTQIINNTFYNSDADHNTSAAGHIYLNGATETIIKNNIFYINGGTPGIPSSFLHTGISVVNAASATGLVSDYNCFYTTGTYDYCGYWAGTGYTSTLANWNSASGQDNTSHSKQADPLFVTVGVDFHIQSQYGSYHDGAWTNDANNSPCIDAGNPSDSYSNEPSCDGSRINIGAYGNTNQASKSNNLIVFTTQPSDYNIYTGCGTYDASFSVVATGLGLTYQWQESTDGGTNWNNLSNGGVYSNVTTSTMNITGATLGMDGYKYRCVVNNLCSSPSATSDVAILHFTDSPTPGEITGDIIVCPNASGVIFSISPVCGASSYEWSVPTGASITSGSGTTSITVTFGSSSGNVSVYVTGYPSNVTSLAVTVWGGGLWTGDVSTDWFDSDNWCGISSPGIPTSSTDIYIPYTTQATNQPYISGDVYSDLPVCRDLTIANGAILTIKQYKSPAVAQGIGWGIQERGCLYIYGNLKNDGTFKVIGCIGSPIAYKTAFPTFLLGSGKTISGSGSYPGWLIFEGPVFEFMAGSSYTLLDNWPPISMEVMGGVKINYGTPDASFDVSTKTIKTVNWNQLGILDVGVNGTVSLQKDWPTYSYGRIMYSDPTKSTWGTNSLMQIAKTNCYIDFGWNDDYYNLEFAPSVGYDYSFTTDMAINGYFKITNGLVYGSNYDGVSHAHNFSLKGDWINNGSYSCYSYYDNLAASSVTLNGTSTQHITSTKVPKTSTTFHSLTINNSQDINAVILDVNTTIGASATDAGVLTLTNGDIVSTATELLTLKEAVTVSPASSTTTGCGLSTSFVSGYLNRLTSTTSGVTYDFPMGDSPSGTWRPMAIKTENTDGRTWLCQMIKTDPNTALGSGVKGDPEWVKGVNIAYYYNLTPSPSASAIDITMYYDPADQPSVAESDYVIGHWVSASSYWDNWTKNTTGDWTWNDTYNWLQVKNVSSFSPITVGNKNHTLPVELLTFNALCKDDIVHLSWATATETNNDYFTVERSKGLIEWEPVLHISGAGNSNTLLYYSAEDNEPYEGISYYRLKQVDFDGQYEIFDPVATECYNTADNLIEIVNTTFNETHDQITVTYYVPQDCKVSIYLVDAISQKIAGINKKAEAGLNAATISFRHSLAIGLYMVTIEGNNNIFTQKIFLH